MADGARRLVFPQDKNLAGSQQGENMSKDTSSPPGERAGARRLSFPPEQELPKSRRLVIPDAVATPPIVEERRSRVITPTEQQTPPVKSRERPRNKTDELLDKARAIDPSIVDHQLRGRIDTILLMSITDILDWGQRNLIPLQETSAKETKLVADIMRVDVTGWLTEAKNASCKTPSFMDRLTGKPPAFYENMLNKIRGELVHYAGELDTLKHDFFREIRDLHHDALSMLVCVNVFASTSEESAAHRRVLTLQAAHQVATALYQTIEKTLEQSAQSVSQIDEFMSITLPSWKMAYSSH